MNKPTFSSFKPFAIGVLSVAAGAAGAFGATKLAQYLAMRADRLVPTRFGVAHLFTTADENGRLMRVLSVGGGWQSVMYLDDPDELVAAHSRGLDVIFSPELAEQGVHPKNVLVVGGAGCCWPRHAVKEHKDLSVTVCEIDPAIIEIARREFHLTHAIEFAGTLPSGEPRLKVVQEDGLSFLVKRKVLGRGAAMPYDVIINDAYAGTSAPSDLLSGYGLDMAKENLAENGLYLVNVVAPAKDPTRVLEARDALLMAFEHIYHLRCPDPLASDENNILIASDRALDIPDACEI